MPAPLKIGIPVLNRGDLLSRLVRSIDVEARVLVVVNRIGLVEASVREAVNVLAEKPPANVQLEISHTEGNLGVAGSWNLILDRFGGDCWIANNDVVFTPGALMEAMAQAAAHCREAAMQHLWAGACFYVAEDFTRRLGWFDENFYPAYHEDQEMAVRSACLGVRRRVLAEIGSERVLHCGSQTLKSSPPNQQRFIQEAQRMGGLYLKRRWGALPPPGQHMPEKRTPFDNPSQHPAAWTLDLEMRQQIARLCAEMMGVACPVVYHRAQGGLG